MWVRKVPNNTTSASFDPLTSKSEATMHRIVYTIINDRNPEKVRLLKKDNTPPANRKVTRKEGRKYRDRRELPLNFFAK